VNELGYNLLSLSQLCDQGNNEAIFTSKDCYVRNSDTKDIILRGIRFKNVYVVDHKYKPSTALCFVSLADETQLWHKRFGHANHQLIHKLHSKELVRGLPKVQPETKVLCEACIRGKQTRTSFKSKVDVTSSRPLELIHMDLCGPMRVTSYT